ncbi:MAG: hypothetical protein RLZZ301_711 [Bacteroidota bacterium]|jgi:tetratricopeptide (TPR) repeat protein
MKKQFLILSLGLVIAGSSFAQKKNVTDAILLMRKYNPTSDLSAAKKTVSEAKSFIDLAAVNAETAEDLKMHLYRAEIYYALNEVALLDAKASNSVTNIKYDVNSNGTTTSGSTTVKVEQGPNPEEIKANKAISVASFKKVMDDPKKLYRSDAESFINMRAELSFSQGINAYNDKKYSEAAIWFMMAYEIKSYIGEEFKDAEVNTSLACNYAVEDYLAAKKYDEANTLIQTAIQAMPKNIDLLISAVNINLQKGDAAATESYINKALAIDPNNKQLYYVLGTSYMDKKENEKATKALQKALEIDPNYNEALYQLGAHLYNLGVEKKTAANALDYKDPKAAQLEKEGDEFFKQALVPLEKYAELNQNDKAILDILYKTNMKLGNVDKAQTYKKRLEALKQ